MVFARCRNRPHYRVPGEYSAPQEVSPSETGAHSLRGRGRSTNWLCACVGKNQPHNGLPDVVLRELPGRKLSRASQNTAFTHTTSIASTSSWSSSEQSETRVSRVANKVCLQVSKPPVLAWSRPSSNYVPKAKCDCDKGTVPLQNITYTFSDSNI